MAAGATMAAGGTTSGMAPQAGGSGGMSSAGVGGPESGGSAGLPGIPASCSPDGSGGKPPCPANQDCVINPIGSYWCQPCGGPNQLCCRSPAGQATECRDGGCCVEHACWADAGPCGPDALGQCHAGKCTGCGNVGESCCGSAEAPSCAAANLLCDAVALAPQGGSDAGGAAGFTGVGAAGAGNPPTRYRLQCVACGDAGQACCAGNSCNAGGCCNPVPSMALRSSCVAPGTKCVDGQTCNAQSCGSCGGKGQPCCSYPSSQFPFCSAPHLLCGASGGDPPACQE